MYVRGKHPSNDMKILLFDIDGTLIDSGGAGRRALEKSIQEICGIENALNGLRLEGKTDPLILREAIEGNSISPTEDIIEMLKVSYIEHLKEQILLAEKSLKPGVSRLLEALGKNAHKHMGLLTGNMEKGAQIKLEPFGILDYFSFGAYGSDNADRNMLLPYAQKRYSEATGIDASAEQFVVIGDTPRDVACAKPYGAMSIAVATGFHTEEELHAAGADVVLGDLTDSRSFLKLVS